MSGGSIHEKWERCNLTASPGEEGGRGGGVGGGEERRGKERKKRGEREERPTVMSLLSKSVVTEDTKRLHLHHLDRQTPESHFHILRSFEPLLKII